MRYQCHCVVLWLVPLQIEEVELKAGGADIDVTEANKKEYVKSVTWSVVRVPLKHLPCVCQLHGAEATYIEVYLPILLVEVSPLQVSYTISPALTVLRATQYMISVCSLHLS